MQYPVHSMLYAQDLPDWEIFKVVHRFMRICTISTAVAHTAINLAKDVLQTNSVFHHVITVGLSSFLFGLSLEKKLHFVTHNDWQPALQSHAINF